MLLSRQRFGQQIGQHAVRWAVGHLNLSLLNSLSNEVVLGVQMLDSSDVVRVVGDGNCSLVVLVDERRLGAVDVQFLE